MLVYIVIHITIHGHIHKFFHVISHDVLLLTFIGLSQNICFVEVAPNLRAIIPTNRARTITTAIMINKTDIMIAEVAGCIMIEKNVNAFS